MRTIGSLFSGIGGLEFGLERSGLGHVAWQVERNEFCCKILEKHWPGVTRFGDIRGLVPPKVDVLCGGFPCQDVSSAGKGAGLKGERSGLWYEFRRIIESIAPSVVVVENVASGTRRWLPHVRRDLHLLGYRTRAIGVSAFDVGAPHRRKRVFVIANTNSERLRDTGWTSKLVDQGKTWAVTEGHWQWSRNSDGWTFESPVCGVAHGIPNRVDRLRALGNAVVPQCAEVIGRIVQAECLQ